MSSVHTSKRYFNTCHEVNVKIIGASQIEPNRWSYAWVEQRPTMQGSWTDKVDGLTSAYTEIAAYNSLEANNSETGVQGNSLNTSQLPDGAEVLPVRGNPVVRARFVMNCAAELALEDDPDADIEDYLELIFQYPNAVSSRDCEEESN